MRRFTAPLLCLTSLALDAAPPSLGPGHTLKPLSSWTDDLGQTHTRYEHLFQGRRVWGSTLVDHAGPRAAPPTLSLAVPPPGQEVVGAGPAGSAARSRPEGEPVFYPIWVEITAGFPGTRPRAEQVDRHLQGYRPAIAYRAEDFDWVVDEETGAVLEKIPVGQMWDAPAKGKGHSFYLGREVELDVSTVGITNMYYLRDQTRGDMTVANARGADTMAGNFVKRSPVWGDGSVERPGDENDSLSVETSAVDLAYSMRTAWDYFEKVHKRRGPDGQGGKIGGILHASPDGHADNAMWRDSLIHVFSPNEFAPQTDIASVTHEFTHGVTQATAHLIYSGESGGLNEATSDFFAVMAATWAARWWPGGTIGDSGSDWHAINYSITPRTHIPPKVPPPRLTLPNVVLAPTIMRNYIEPGKVSPGYDPSPGAWSPTLKYLDPHEASGPMLRALYGLSAGLSRDPASPSHSGLLPGGMKGIGNDKTARIWYKTLTTYLTENSNYADARTGALQAAQDIHGANSPEVRAVGNAFAAIGVGPRTPHRAGQAPTLSAEAFLRGTELELRPHLHGHAGAAVVHYFVDGLFVGAADRAPHVLTLDARRTFRRGRHTLTAKAYSPEGLEAESAPSPFTLSLPAQQLVENPGFEGGPQDWEGLPAGQVVGYPGGAHGGEHWVQFDAERCAAGPGSFRQTVSLPTGGYARLKFWAFIQGNPAHSDGSILRIQVTEPAAEAPAGEPPRILAEVALDSTDAWPAWVCKEMNLATFTGTKVDLVVSSDIRRDTDSVFKLDDFQLLTGPGSLVEVRVAPSRMTFRRGDDRPREVGVGVRGTDAPGVVWHVQPPGRMEAVGNRYRFHPPSQPGTYRMVAESTADPRATAELTVVVQRDVALHPEKPRVTAGTTRTLALVTAPGVVVDRVEARGLQTHGAAELVGPGRIRYTAPARPGKDVIYIYGPDGLLGQAVVWVLPR